MMPAPFMPSDGKTGRARRLAALVADKAPGDGITYGEAEELLDCDRSAVQAAMRDAMAILERDGRRSVRTVVNFGWVVMKAAEHIDAASHHLTKSRNSARRSLRKTKPLGATLRGELTQEQRWAADQARLTAAAVEAMASRGRKSFAELAATAKTALPPMS
jgi:hypothetical protein